MVIQLNLRDMKIENQAIVVLIILSRGGKENEVVFLVLGLLR